MFSRNETTNEVFGKCQLQNFKFECKISKEKVYAMSMQCKEVANCQISIKFLRRIFSL